MRRSVSPVGRAVAVFVAMASMVALGWVPAPPASASTSCPARASNASHSPGRAARIRGWLHTCPDGTIRNQWGHKIRLNGLEYFRLGWGATGAGKCNSGWEDLPSSAASDISRWGFNSVELFFSWQNLEPAPPTYDPVNHTLVHHYDPAYLASLDSAIHALTGKGIAVVLVLMQSRWSSAFQDITDAGGVSYPCGLGTPPWIYEQDNAAAGGGLEMVKAERRFYQDTQMVHDAAALGSETMQTSFTKMWKFLVRRYASNHLVVGAFPMFEAYDILTRSYEGANSVTPAMLDLAGFFERVSHAIHNVNPHLINYFAEQRSKTTHKWALLRRPRIPNGALASEFYMARWPGSGASPSG